MPARRSASWASRAAASRRWRARRCGSSGRAPGASCGSGARSRSCRRAELRAAAPRAADRVPGSAGSLDPRMTVREIVAEPLASMRRRLSAAARDAAVAAMLARVGLPAGALGALPARALRRPVPARRHRARHDPEAAAPRLRRAGERARCHHPGADRAAARRAASASTGLTLCSSATTSRWCAACASGCWCCISGA